MSKPSKNEPTINELMGELDALVAWFNQDDLDIEAALVKYEEAMKLSATIRTRLNDMDNQITVLRQRFDVEAG